MIICTSSLRRYVLVVVLILNLCHHNWQKIKNKKINNWEQIMINNKWEWERNSSTTKILVFVWTGETNNLLNHQFKIINCETVM